MIIAAAILALAAPAELTAGLMYMECDILGKVPGPRIWRITLNPQTGTADVGPLNATPYRASAAFQTDRVILYHGTGRVEINRETLKFLRFHLSENAPVDGGQCKLESPPDKVIF